MITEIQSYYDNDPDFAQFVKRHGVVAAIPDIRNAYRLWKYDQILNRFDEERRETEHKDRIAEGEARGYARGIAKAKAKAKAKAEAKVIAEMRKIIEL